MIWDTRPCSPPAGDVPFHKGMGHLRESTLNPTSPGRKAAADTGASGCCKHKRMEYDGRALSNLSVKNIFIALGIVTVN